jgi:DNA-binding protein HU-beta
MNKAELVEAVAKSTGQSKATVDSVLNGTIETIEKAVAKGDKVTITGFLSVERVARKARTGRNPRTGETIKIPASKAVKVSAGAKLKNTVKGRK